MTNKTPEKSPRAKRIPEEPTAETLKAALEIHSLVQMIYAELAVTRPWLAGGAPGLPWRPGAYASWPPPAPRPW